MLRVVPVFVLCLVLAACGNSGHNSTSNTTAPKATTSTTEPAQNDAWIDAATRGVEASSQAKSVTPAQARCFARALIDSVTVARLKAAGVTMADLADPKRDLPAGFSESVPTAAKVDFGAALQRCGFARVIGPELAQSVASSQSSPFRMDARTQACVVDAFGAPAHRLLSADLLLSPSPSASDASDLAQLLLGCVDFSQIIQPNLPFVLAPSEAACINGKARTDPNLRKVVAGSILGSGASDNSDADKLLSATLITCLTPDHVLQLGNSG